MVEILDRFRPVSVEELSERSQQLRLEILSLIEGASLGHYSSSLSAAEILVTLYHHVLRLRPSFFRLTEDNHYPVYTHMPDMTPGKFIQVREGNDATIIGTGMGTQLAAGAADELAREGLRIRVLDAAYIKPLDEEAIVDAASNTGAILTVEEHNVNGGLGFAVGEVLARSGLASRFAISGLPDEPLVVGVPLMLYEHYGLTVKATAQRLRQLLSN